MDKNRIRLEDLKKETPFSVPDGYFEKLPQVIQSRITSGADLHTQRQRIWSWQWGTLAASAMVLILVLVWITVPERQGALGKEPLAEVSDASIMEYLEDQNISYFDLSEQKVVQKAFETDSTVMFYLDGMDDDVLQQQIMESAPVGLDKI